MAKDENDIWGGYKLNVDKDAHYTPPPIWWNNSQNDESSGFLDVLKIIALCVFIVLMLVLPMFGPSLWHSALVVCNGGRCTTYTKWTVINENAESGVLEVWAGGRLQRLSNGTWHYE